MQVSRHFTRVKMMKKCKTNKIFSDFYDCSDLRINEQHTRNQGTEVAQMLSSSFFFVIYIKKKHVCFLESIALGCCLVTLCKCKHLFGIKNASLSSSSSSFLCVLNINAGVLHHFSSQGSKIF